ncbi:MAG: extracellular solute-binding protein [Planctomycetota bacterium]
MIWSRFWAFAAFALILGVPFAMRGAAPDRFKPGTPKVIIITPHVRQISEEFGAAFKVWHKRVYAQEIEVDWRGPLGTSEIVKLLQAQFTSHIKRRLEEVAKKDPAKLSDPSFSVDADFEPGDLGYDLMLGGGSYDHGRLKSRANATVTVAAFPNGGMVDAELSIQLPADRPKPERLGEMTDIVAGVVVAASSTKPVKLRIPIAAVEGGAASLAPLAEGKAAKVRVNSSQLLRDFSVQMSIPAGLTKEELKPLTPNAIGAENLYDPEQFWIGTALSSFGVVYNREMFADMGLPEPTSFDDLRTYKLRGLVALADPRQSGSLTTAIDMILNSHVWSAAGKGGWLPKLLERDGLMKAAAEGHEVEIDQAWAMAWRSLREITANARYYAYSSTKPPIDVSQGEAAAGLAIDFYGKTQAQSVLKAGQQASTGRVGYLDPLGQTNYDADPVSILRGAPNPELAKRFVRFCLTTEAQALWQFPAAGPGAQTSREGNPKGESGEPMGPREYELRRLPIRADMYEPYRAVMIDKINPFERAPMAKPVGWRDAIGVMMPSFSVDVMEDQQAAWDAIHRCRATPDFPSDRLGQMLRLFYSFPETTVGGAGGAGGKALEFTPENFPAIAKAWREAKSTGKLKSDFTLGYTAYFRKTYREVVRLGSTAGAD